MKKAIVIFLVAIIATVSIQAQKAEVLYFKADLGCCNARTCDQLETEIKNIVESNFADKGVIFKQVKISDEANKSLVEKHKARSQTVVVVSGKGKKEIDASHIITAYLRSRNKANLEKDLIALITEAIK
jgi:hypothetical protein